MMLDNNVVLDLVLFVFTEKREKQKIRIQSLIASQDSLCHKVIFAIVKHYVITSMWQVRRISG